MSRSVGDTGWTRARRAKTAGSVAFATRTLGRESPRRLPGRVASSASRHLEQVRLRCLRQPGSGIWPRGQCGRSGGWCSASWPRVPRPKAERALKLKAVKLEKEVQDLTMRYQRAVADGENIRRRTQRCVEDAKIFGIQSFCKDLVEVADILEKTTEYISEETEPGDQKLTLEKIFRGLSLLEAKLKSVFAKHGLEKMTPIGDKYDPHEHELICHVPAGVGVQPGTVALVRQDGYKLHGRTIRLAQVEVAVESQRRL
ncbi:grpE protein homolog 2, mitochondrial isoform X1 [Prionailurus bengalensis]|uniref:grpE protein homolog 2, mitochondrial isoform X1 n=1 Tax=Prionailurus bengalensis TaxID=37029 RepID=UPI001CA9D5A3|nr:grpE protein homolog 2, mitochondrial isoform X1 [Prionailurus bengalensis]